MPADTTGDDGEETPLHNAILNFREKEVERLLDEGTAIDARDEEGRTALHMADTLETVSILISRGAPVDARDEKDRTPLHSAVERAAPETAQQDSEIINLLLTKGADPDATDVGGKTPLHLLAESDYRKPPEVAEVLLEKGGADVNATCGNGQTPLHRAADQNSVQIAWVLVGREEVKVNATDASGKTPLHRAADLNSAPEGLKVARMLMKEKEETIRINVQDEDGKTPLHDAAWKGHLDVVEELIRFGADICQEDSQGRKPLQHLDLSGRERLAASRHSDVRSALVTCPNPPELISLMRKAGSEPDLSGRSSGSLTGTNSLTEAERKRLCEAGPYGEQLVAAHPDTPLNDLIELAEAAPSEFVRNLARRGIDLENPEWRQNLSWEGWVAVLEDAEVPTEWLREGAKHEDWRVRQAVAGSEDAPPKVIWDLAVHDLDPHVYEAAKTNPKCPDQSPRSM